MTETTQPDPQVVAWMRDYLRGMPDTAGVGLVRAYRDSHSPDGTTSALLAATGIGLAALRAAAQEALRKPLTVTDIPAGQGPASLYLWRDPVSGEDGPETYAWNEGIAP